MRSRTVLASSLRSLVAACSSGGASPSARPSRRCAIAAASAPRVELERRSDGRVAQATAAMAEAKTAYEAANPGTTLTVSTDSSAALETQIEQGAPADVFLSADTTNPQKLVDGGFAVGRPRSCSPATS